MYVNFHSNESEVKSVTNLTFCKKFALSVSARTIEMRFNYAALKQRFSNFINELFEILLKDLTTRVLNQHSFNSVA